MVECLGKSRRYRLTALGLKLGVLLVKLRTRPLGPLATIVSNPTAQRAASCLNPVDTASQEVDTALELWDGITLPAYAAAGS